jgi:hypothetical protein
MSDASAAVALDERRIVVADDETNELRLYDAARGGPPLSSHDLTAFLEIGPGNPEADLEGGVRVGDRIYWVSSHESTKKGKYAPNRHRFFATTFRVTGEGVTVTGLGRPFRGLAGAIAAVLGLEGALSIEGLAASPDGQTLYLGLRQPRAVVVPLTNAKAVTESGAEPALGKPLLWDLGGLGIRSLEYSSRHAAFFVLAGPTDEGSRFELYRWSGKPEDAPQRVQPLDSSAWGQPEALLSLEGSAELLLLSDDGTLRVAVASRSECLEDYGTDGTCPNKRLRAQASKSFRGFRMPCGS